MLLDDPLQTRKLITSSAPQPCGPELSLDKALTLGDAVNLALCNNPQTRQSWATLLAQAANLGSARSSYIPSLNGSAGIGRSFSASPGFRSAGTSSSSGVSLSYLLFDFGGRNAAVESTKQALIAADYSRNATLQSVLFSVIQAYYQHYSAKTAAAAAELSVKSAEASVEAANLRYVLGAATKSDQLQAETTYAQALLSQEQADNQATISKGTLANALGISPSAPFAISEEAPKSLNASFSEEVEALLEEAKRSRPDLAASAAQVESSRIGINSARSAGLPTVSISAGRDYSFVNAGRGDNSFSSSISASVSIPLFSGFSDSYRIEAAKQSYAAQAAGFEQTRNNVLLDVWRSWSNYKTSQQTLKMTDTLLSSASRAEEVALGRYKAGAGSITELLNAQAQLASARQQRVQAEYNWLIAKADLLRATGLLDRRQIEGTS